MRRDRDGRIPPRFATARLAAGQPHVRLTRLGKAGERTPSRRGCPGGVRFTVTRNEGLIIETG